MTLIITCIRPRDILLTSDSRATFNNPSPARRFDDTCPKLFAMTDHPLVIAHHGENDLGGKFVDEFIGEFFAHLNAGNLSITEVADHLRAHAHSAVRNRLQELPVEGHGCGFLVAGFGADDAGPQVSEIFWRRSDDAIINEERAWHPIAVVPSGNGTTQIDKVDWHQIDNAKIEGVEKYVDRLFDEAIQADVHPNTVGGPLQRILIRREGWEWIKKPPNRSGPSTRPTTGPAQ